jgi:hypothetical protein
MISEEQCTVHQTQRFINKYSLFSSIMDLSGIVEFVKHPGITHLPTYILTGMGTAIAATGSILHEIQRSKTIPLAYAEIEIIRKQLTEEKPLTQFLACTNDFCMNIFEAHNAAYDKKKMMQGFGDALQERNYNHNDHLGIQTLGKEAVQYAKQVKEKLASHEEAMKGLQIVIERLDKAWQESHIDSYRTEIYYDTEYYTDSQGRSQSRQVMRTRQVYDHTTHEYWYDRNEGVAASYFMHDILKKIPQLQPFESVETAAKVSDEGKIAALKSRKKNILLEEDYEKISRIWKEGTAHDDNLVTVVNDYATLPSLLSPWDVHKETAKSNYCYITYSHYDSGPEEYQSAKKLQGTTEEITQKIGGLLDHLQYVTATVPALQNNIEQYFLLMQQPNKKEIKKAGKTILHDTKELYSTIFNKGIDVDLFKEWHVGIWTILGAGAGLGLGMLGEYLLTM